MEQGNAVIEEGKELLFQKGTMIGNITYKRIRTSVKLYPDKILIHKETKKIFRKEVVDDRAINLVDIAAAGVHTALDFWDTLYAVIFAILGFFNPAIFLIAAVFLWCGYGKKFEIIMTSGEKYTIPLKGSKQETGTLLAICNPRS